MRVYRAYVIYNIIKLLYKKFRIQFSNIENLIGVALCLKK